MVRKCSIESILAVLQSPKKKRRAKAEKNPTLMFGTRTTRTSLVFFCVILMSIYELIDILGASKARWTSAVYDHYETLFRCHTKGDRSPEYREFVFTCRTDPANHRPRHRKREQTGQGTKNLNRGLIECAARRIRG